MKKIKIKRWAVHLFCYLGQRVKTWKILKGMQDRNEESHSSCVQADPAPTPPKLELGFAVLLPLQASLYSGWMSWQAEAFWQPGWIHDSRNGRQLRQRLALARERWKNWNCIAVQEFAWQSEDHRITSAEDESFTEGTGSISAQNE